jgi:hypothetical protein
MAAWIVDSIIQAERCRSAQLVTSKFKLDVVVATSSCGRHSHLTAARIVPSYYRIGRVRHTDLSISAMGTSSLNRSLSYARNNGLQAECESRL